MKILIINPNMTTGGLETSLLNFINELKGENEIDMFLLSHEGKLMSALPKDITLLPEQDKLKRFGVVRQPVNRGLVKAIAVKMLKAVGVKNMLIDRDLRALADINIQSFAGEYDLAINFNAYDHICNQILIDKVNAKRKFAIVHNDVFVMPFSRKLIQQLDALDVCLGCSKSCMEHIKQKHSKLKNVDYLYNFQDTKKFVDKSNEKCDSIRHNKFNFVCVGRMSKQKMPLRLLKVIKRLNREFDNFDVYFLGEGELTASAKKYVERNRLNNVYLLGNQTNPYKYIKQADMLLLASKNEAAPMVYAEAMTLGVPVLSTRTCSADELVGELGVVCDNNFNAIYTAIKDVLSGKVDLTALKNQLENYSWFNQAIKQKLYTLTKEK